MKDPIARMTALTAAALACVATSQDPGRSTILQSEALTIEVTKDNPVNAFDLVVSANQLEELQQEVTHVTISIHLDDVGQQANALTLLQLSEQWDGKSDLAAITLQETPFSTTWDTGNAVLVFADLGLPDLPASIYLAIVGEGIDVRSDGMVTVKLTMDDIGDSNDDFSIEIIP